MLLADVTGYARISRLTGGNLAFHSFHILSEHMMCHILAHVVKCFPGIFNWGPTTKMDTPIQTDSQDKACRNSIHAIASSMPSAATIKSPSTKTSDRYETSPAHQEHQVSKMQAQLPTQRTSNDNEVNHGQNTLGIFVGALFQRCWSI